MVFVISVVSVISTCAALNPLVCGFLSCLRCFRDSHRFREAPRLQDTGLANHRFRNAVQMPEQSCDSPSWYFHLHKDICAIPHSAASQGALKVTDLSWPVLVDPAEWSKIGLLNRDFGSILSVFPRKNSKTESSLNFLQSGPRKFTKSDFLGLAPIRRVLIFSRFWENILTEF